MSKYSICTEVNEKKAAPPISKFMEYWLKSACSPIACAGYYPVPLQLNRGDFPVVSTMNHLGHELCQDQTLQYQILNLNPMLSFISREEGVAKNVQRQNENSEKLMVPTQTTLNSAVDPKLKLIVVTEINSPDQWQKCSDTSRTVLWKPWTLNSGSKVFIIVSFM